MDAKLLRRLYKIGYFLLPLIGLAFGLFWFIVYVLVSGFTSSPLVLFFVAIPFGFGIVIGWFMPIASSYCSSNPLFYKLFCTDIAQINLFVCSSMLFWSLVFFFAYRNWLKKYRPHYV